jgi:CubicO group peptidase (beta-lactamase class C family)
MTIGGGIRIRALSVSGLALVLAACSGQSEGSSSEETLASSRAALSSAVAGTLACPELDLNVPAGYWWMHSASAATIDAKLAEGYRLISLDVVSTSPLLFAATFVGNSGVYQRSGGAWDSDMTEAELLQVKSDPARRIVDLVPYTLSGVRRYAATWISNTGTQTKQYDLILAKSPADFMAAVTAFSGRVLTVHTEPSGASVVVSGVMVKNTGNDARTQWLGYDDNFAIRNVIKTNAARLVDLDSSTTDGKFFYVVEQHFDANPQNERLWWAGDSLFFDSLDNFDNPDSLMHLPRRLNGRYVRLKGRSTGTGPLYSAVLADNGPLPQNGSDNAGNSVLNEIDTFVNNSMKRAAIPGVLLAVAVDGRLVHARGYGYSDLNANRAMQPTDLLRVASVSKTLTTVAVLNLIQQSAQPGGPKLANGSALTLDTHPWGEIFSYTAPAFTPNLGTLTVRHLLEHSAGLHTDFEWQPGPADYVNVEKNLGAAEFVNAPGTAAAVGYKNSHFHMLGHVVSQVSGTSYEAYTRAALFDPLGLDRVRIAHATRAPDEPGLFQAINYERMGRLERQSKDAMGTIYEGDPLNRGDWVQTPADRYPASTFAASPIDLMRFAAALDGTRWGFRPLDATRFAAISDRAASPAGRYLGFFGEGMFGQDYSRTLGTGALDHNGWLPGVTTAQIRLFGNGVKYAFATSSDASVTSDFLGSVRDGLDAILIDPAKRAALPNRDLFDTYLPSPCLSDFHNVPIGKFQQCFDYWTTPARNLWPQTLTVSSDGARISGSFQTVSARETHHMLPAATYEQITQANLAVGVIPNHVNIVNLGGALRFTATWLPANAPGASYWGMTATDYETRWHDLANQGYLQTDLFPYTDGSLRFAGTWKKVPNDGYASYWGLTDATLASRQAELGPSYKITHFISYRDAGQLRRAAIWQRTGGTWQVTHDTSGASYQTTYNSMNSQGYRIHQLHSYDADSFDAVWKKPSAAQGVFGFEAPNGYTVVSGSATLSTSSTAIEGAGSLSLLGGNFVEIRSPQVSTADIRAQSLTGTPSTLAFDLQIPTQQPNPYWVGGAQLFIDIPSANINHLYIGQVELTPLPRGSFTTLSYALPQSVRTAIAGTYSDVRINIALNINSGTPAYLLDNLRFL